MDAWSGANGYRRMMLRDLAVDVHLGLHPWERHPERPQRILINVDMYADDVPPEPGADITAFVDYDYVRNALKAWPQRPHTDYIETLVEELITLCFHDPRVRACKVSIQKPDIFSEAAGAGVEVFRIRK